MGVMSRIVSGYRNSAFVEPFWGDFMRSAKSGVAVNAKTALQVAAVFDCLRVLGEGVAQVPFKLFKARPGGKGSDPALIHPNYRIAYRRPNSWQTSFEFRENLVFQAGLLGNFYCFKNIVRGVLRELIPFPPGSCTPRIDFNTGKIVYCVSLSNVGVTIPGGHDTYREFPAEAIWHVKGPSWDTVTGMEAVKLARETIGLAIATEESHALLHANGAQASGIYSVDGMLDHKGFEQLQAWVEKNITGANRYRPLILDRGGKFTQTSMSGVDSQHIETRKFQIEEICRMFRVMPIMLGAGEKTSTYASAEQMFLAHVVHTLSPWYERIEQSADVNLLNEQEQDAGYYYKFLPNGLMRGAAKDRAEYMWKMWQMKAINSNEIRAFEEMNPYPEGDDFYVEQGNGKQGADIEQDSANTGAQDEKTTSTE